MDPIVTSVVSFLVVAGIITVIAVFYLRDADRSRAAERLDNLVGKGGRRESSADLLLKQALLEVDRKTILDVLSPKFVSLERAFEQADANIRPSALFAISIGMTMVGGMLSALIARTIYVAPVGGAIFFAIPWLWLWNKRRARLNLIRHLLNSVPYKKVDMNLPEKIPESQPRPRGATAELRVGEPIPNHYSGE